MLLQIASMQDVSVYVEVCCGQNREKILVRAMENKCLHLQNSEDLSNVEVTFHKPIWIKIVDLVWDVGSMLVSFDEDYVSCCGIEYDNFVLTKIEFQEKDESVEICYQQLTGENSRRKINVGIPDYDNDKGICLFDDKCFDNKLKYIYLIVLIDTLICLLPMLIVLLYSLSKKHYIGLGICGIVCLGMGVLSLKKCAVEKGRWKFLKRELKKDIEIFNNSRK